MAEEEPTKPRSTSKRPVPLVSRRTMPRPKKEDEASHNSSEESNINKSRRHTAKAAGGSRARVNMRKSIMLFEEKLQARTRQSRDRAKSSNSKDSSKERDKSKGGEDDKKDKRSLRRKNSSRSLSRPRKVKLDESENHSPSDKEGNARESRDTGRKRMARSVGINSNERSSSGVVLKSPMPEERDKSDSKRDKESTTTGAGGKKKEETPDKSKSTSNKLSKSTPGSTEAAVESALNAAKKLPRKDSQDDLSLLWMRKLHKPSHSKSHSKGNSFDASAGNTSDLLGLADLRKSKNHEEHPLHKSKDLLDKSDRDRKDNKGPSSKLDSKIDGSNRHKSSTEAKKEILGRRHSDDFSKSIVKSATGRQPQLRRNSMDESTLELSASTKKKAPLKKIPSMSSIGHVDTYTKSDGDALAAFTSAPWGKGGNKLKKTFNSSDGGISLDKTDKDKKKSEAVSTADKNEASIVRKTLSTSASSTAKVDKKKSVRKPQQQPSRTAKVDTAAPVAVVQEKGIRISRLTLCAVCIMYIVSLALVGVLGFWVHMTVFPVDEKDLSSHIPEWVGGGEEDKATLVVADNASGAEGSDPTFSPSTFSPSITAVPTTETHAPTAKPTKKKNKPNNKQPSKPEQQAATSKNENSPSESITPTISTPPTITPLPSSLTPTMLPSLTPTTSSPILAPSSLEPTSSHSPSSGPSMSPSLSAAPSSSPTGIPKCPEELIKTADLGPDSLITMRYEIIPLPLADPYGGLFCVSIEYEGNAGWIGFAVSGASRDPAFGRKEAIIGIPGVSTLVAVADPSKDVAVGQQVGTGIIDGPALINPGKYEIPAGGGVDGYTGPSIDTLLDMDRQTLLNSSIAIVGPDDNPLQKALTTMTFTKYLIEPEEIEIDPFASTLFLYAVATIDEDGEYNDNPEWVANYVTLLQAGGTAVERDGVKRKRLRHHLNFDS
jgi:nitrate reductase NapE component